jgi:hypothetical protein
MRQEVKKTRLEPLVPLIPNTYPILILIMGREYKKRRKMSGKHQKSAMENLQKAHCFRCCHLLSLSQVVYLVV